MGEEGLFFFVVLVCMAIGTCRISNELSQSNRLERARMTIEHRVILDKYGNIVNKIPNKEKNNAD